MANMGNYCKAYPIERFREFSGWSEKLPVSAGPDQEDGGYLFLQENLVVTEGIFLDEKVVFDQVTPEWEAFCKDKLEFEIPEYCYPSISGSEESTEAVAQTGAVK